MDITRRSDYACRILRALCTHEGQFRSVAEIAQEEDIPYSFARSIQHDLVKAGLLRTERGVHGGVTMAVDCAEVTLLDVMRVVQGKVGIAPCSQDPQYCQKAAGCAYHGVWCQADKLLANYFASITLADLFRTMNDGVECPQVTARKQIEEGEGEAVA
ncbi:MAG: Rrf2 family transcriptional regulator [Eggerthellaceae bacterium]|nr:Rrf2 family transcriptional regulator [Eggerthellaceae bacterium]